MHRATVGSYGGGVSYERGTPLVLTEAGAARVQSDRHPVPARTRVPRSKETTSHSRPTPCHLVRTRTVHCEDGPPRAGEGGEEVIYVDIRHESILGKTSLKRIPLTRCFL